MPCAHAIHTSRLAALRQDLGQDLAPPRERHLCWADLMARVFELDVLECPRCSGRCRGDCRDHRAPGHPALPGLSGPFHTRAAHRPRTTGPAAGAPTLTRLPWGVLGSDITPLAPRRIRVLEFRAGTAIRRLAGTNTPAYPSSGRKGASERRSLPRFGPDSAAEMTIHSIAQVTENRS